MRHNPLLDDKAGPRYIASRTVAGCMPEVRLAVRRVYTSKLARLTAES
jgi:hypothetical protein